MFLVALMVLSSCEKAGGIIEKSTVTISDSDNHPGKWSNASDVVADLYLDGSLVKGKTKAVMQDAKSGVMTFSFNEVKSLEHNLVIYSPTNLSVPSGQNSSTSEVRAAMTAFTPKKKDASLSVNLAPITGKLTVNVKSESTEYPAWNLENISITAASPICGTFTSNSKGIAISGDESNTVLYEFSSPSALRTKAQSASFHIRPTISSGSRITIAYTLEKDGKRVDIKHNTIFSGNLAAGGEATIDETIPETVGGDWTAEGSGVKYTNVFPGKAWETTSPESRGYSSAKFENLRKVVEGMSTTSMMVAVGGKVIFSYGDVTENVKIASCRKSLLSTLYGKYVENGTIDLNKTLKELGIDEAADSWGGSDVNWDGGSLLESEKEATIKDLLTARSGIFHKPANSGDDHNYMTAADRGKYKHGTYYLYNNWDFNCAGGIFEMLTGQNIYAAFKSDIADPCQWQDYDLAKQKKTEDYKGASQFLAYHFWISTRDMLRMALLMLNKGNWNGTRVVSEQWANTITTTYTKRADMHPSYRLSREFEYGYLWWTFCPQYSGYDPAIFEGGFTATGSGGQYMTVLPALNMVIAHKDKTQAMDKSTYYNLIKQVAACKE